MKRRRPVTAPEVGALVVHIQHTERGDIRVPAVIDFVYRDGRYNVRTRGGQRVRARANGNTGYGCVKRCRDDERDEMAEFMEVESG